MKLSHSCRGEVKMHRFASLLLAAAALAASFAGADAKVIMAASLNGETQLEPGSAQSTEAEQREDPPSVLAAIPSTTPLVFPPHIKRVWLNIGSWRDPPVSPNEDTVTIAVEPLLSVIKDIRPHPRLLIIPCAISGFTGFHPFYAYNDGLSSSLSPAREDIPDIANWKTKALPDAMPRVSLVPVLTLRDLFAAIPLELDIEMIKTDMQGHDLSALKSAGLSLRRARYIHHEAACDNRTAYEGAPPNDIEADHMPYFFETLKVFRPVFLFNPILCVGNGETEGDWMRVGGYDPLHDSELLRELQATSPAQARALLAAAPKAIAKTPQPRHLEASRASEEAQGLPALTDPASARARAATGRGFFLFFHNILYATRYPTQQLQDEFDRDVNEHKRNLLEAAIARNVTAGVVVDANGQSSGEIDLKAVITSEDDYLTPAKSLGEAGMAKAAEDDSLFGEMRFGFGMLAGKRYARYPCIRINVTLKKHTQTPSPLGPDGQEPEEEQSTQQRLIDLPAEIATDLDVDFLLTSAWS